jgi:hypothetical protein
MHKNNPTKCPKFKCNTVSVSFSACRCNSVVLLSKVGRQRKKKSLETVLRMVSATVACLPAAVSLLLLEVLFMQISGVSLALTWPCRLCLFRVLLCGSLCYKLSPFQALGKVTLCLCSQACVFIYSSCGRWVFPPLLCSSPSTTTFTSFPAPDYWAVLLFLPATMFVYSSCGKGSSLLSCGVFLPLPLSQAFPLLVAGRTPLLPPEALQPARLVYLQSQEGFPSPNLWCSVHPTLFPACLICSYCLLLSFSFFPWLEVSLSRGAMLLWPRLVCGSTAVL